MPKPGECVSTYSTDVVKPYRPVARLRGVLGGPRPSVALEDNRMRIDQCDPEYLTNYTRVGQTSVYSGCPVSSADRCGSGAHAIPGQLIAQPNINGCLGFHIRPSGEPKRVKFLVAIIRSVPSKGRAASKKPLTATPSTKRR